MSTSRIFPSCILTLTKHRSRARGDSDLYARGDYDMYARSDDSLYLAARDLDSVTLLARDLLYARLDEPKREHYATKEQYEKAWKSWNRHNGEILREYQKTLAEHPHAGQPQPHGDHDAWKKWAQDNRHVANHMQNTMHREGHEHHKDIQRIEAGKDPKCRKRRGSKCVVS